MGRPKKPLFNEHIVKWLEEWQEEAKASERKSHFNYKKVRFLVS